MKKMSLSVRSKILIAVGGSILLLALVSGALFALIILPSYERIERDSVIEDVNRAKDAITNFNHQQTIKVRDWAQWDDTNKFALDQNDVFTTENAVPASAMNLDISLMLFMDKVGTPLYWVAVDLTKGEAIDGADIARAVSAEKDLVVHPDMDDSDEGIIMLPEGPLLATSRPTKNTDGSGPSNGAVVFARFLDGAKVQELANLAHLSFTVFRYDSATLPEDVARARALLAPENPYVIVPVSRERVDGYGVINDFHDKPALIVRVQDPRPVYAQGQLTLYLYLGISALALLLVGLLTVLMLEQLVISRFVRLTKDVEAINQEQDLTIRVRGGGTNDDIGALAEKINQMLSWLFAARQAEAAARREAVNLLSDLSKAKEQAEEMIGIQKQQLGKDDAPPKRKNLA